MGGRAAKLHAMGGQIMIDSDSHDARTIGAGFAQAEALAIRCGFTHTLVLAPGGGFQRVPIG